MSRLPEATAGLGDLVGRPMETHSKVLVDEAEEYECVGFEERGELMRRCMDGTDTDGVVIQL